MIDTDALRRRLADPYYKQLLMQDPRDLLGSYMLDREGLQEFAGDGPLNTDLNPRVLFDAPKSAYENAPELAYGALFELINRRTPVPRALVGDRDGRPDDEMLAGARRFSAALGHYMQGEIARTRAAGAMSLSPEIIEHYLRAYDSEPEFSAAAGLLYAIAKGNPEVAGQILSRMLERTPGNRRAYDQYLQHLENSGDRERLEDLLEYERKHFEADVIPVR